MKPILIVEDHPLVAQATQDLVHRYARELQPVVCSDATETLRQLDDQRIEWFRILLDLDIPGAFGLSLAREVQQRGFHRRCCIVSAFARTDYIEELRSSGFLGYIVKAAPIAEFSEALARVIEGTPTFPAFPLAGRAANPRLTRRQTQLLDHVRQGHSSKQISALLHIAEGTINNHVAAILRALDVSTRAQAVAKAIELGLLSAIHVPGPEQPWRSRRDND